MAVGSRAAAQHRAERSVMAGQVQPAGPDMIHRSVKLVRTGAGPENTIKTRHHLTSHSQYSILTSHTTTQAQSYPNPHCSLLIAQTIFYPQTPNRHSTDCPYFTPIKLTNIEKKRKKKRLHKTDTLCD